VHPEDRNRFIEQIDKAFREKADFALDYRIVLPDGTVKHIHGIGHPVLDQTGNIIEYVGTDVDVTERKRAEEKLQRSEADLLEAQRLSHTSSWRYDVSSGKLTNSPEGHRIHGIQPKEDASAPELYFSRIHPEDRERIRDLFERSKIQKTDYDGDYRIVLPDGAIKHLHAVGHPILDEPGELVEFIGTVMDITERKHTEEALRRSEGYLAEAQRLTHTGSWVWNVRTEALFWSQEIFRIYDCDPEMTPTWDFLLERVHPEDRAAIERRKKMEFTQKEWTDSEIDFRIVLPDGTIKHLHSIGHPVMDESGEITEVVGTVIDVTDRKRAQEAVQRSEGYLAEAQKLTHTGSWAARVPQMENVYWSEEMYRIFELDPGPTPPTFAEVVTQRLHPDDAPHYTRVVEQTIRDRTDYETDCRLLLPNGAAKYIHVVGHPVANASGDVIELVGTAMDVTEQHEASAALQTAFDQIKAEQAELRRMTDAIATYIYVLRPDGTALYANQTVLDYTGLTLEDVQREVHREQVFHPDDVEKLREERNEALARGVPFENEQRALGKDGKYRWFLVRYNPLRDDQGHIIRWYATGTDIDDRKRAEALRDGESRILERIARDAPLEEILENLVRVVEDQFSGLWCSVLLLDEDGQHVRHGAALSLPDAYTKSIDGLCIGPKAGSCGTAMYRREPVVVIDILQDPLWEAYRDVAEPYGLRACWSTPILAHSGKPLGSFAMYYREPRSPSPAENRALEMATHLAGIAIERKLAGEERERLRQAQAELAHVSRVTTMGELTASLAHEVRQPIAAALTDAETCLHWLGGDSPNIKEARAAVTRVVKDGTCAAEIISRIRLLFNKGAPQHELVDVNQVIAEMIVLLRGEITRYSISVRTELAANLPQVIGDRVQLQQVLLNLMINSIDAMKGMDGTRELAIRSQRAENEGVVVSVTDSGVGLPPQQGDQIFNAFFTTKPHGTGMGLRISRTIIESHGGRLWATALSGRGATFHFTLPSAVTADQVG
jgi:PAS domain S-box-containing protein